MPKLFISYAREDDEPFAKYLYAALEAEGFDVWWDREAMESRGVGFAREIGRAIDAAARILLVIGPHAAESEYVRAEWTYANTKCKIIVPVLRIGTDSLVPPELRTLHYIDFRPERDRESAWRELVRILQSKMLPPGMLHGVDALPPHFLPRPEEMRRLLDEIIGSSGQLTAISSAPAPAAVQGMGGVGKSVLAAAFAHHGHVRRTFSDGIFWLRIGRSPDIGRVLQELAAMLRLSAVDSSEITAEAREFFASTSCLLVIDDVWNLEDLKSIAELVQAPSRILFTTRDGTIATSIGATELRLDLLADDEALALLADWAGQALDDFDSSISDVIRQCGNLPLALALCGALHRDGVSWSDILHSLQNADLEFLTYTFPDYPYESALKALGVSIEALRATNEPAADRYNELAVFRDGKSIPLQAIETLWKEAGGLSPARTRKLLTQLERKALLRIDSDESGSRVSLHDLQYDYLIALAKEPRELHRLLLHAYRSSCGDDWARGPDDGYFFDHLAHHLHEAGETDELFRLLGPSWQNARVRIADSPRGLVQDADIVMEAAAHSEPVDLHHGFRAALVKSTLLSAATRIPARALQALARIGEVERALAYSSLNTNVGKRVQAICAIAGVLQLEERDDEARNTVELAMELVGMGSIAKKSKSAIAIAPIAGTLGLTTILTKLGGLSKLIDDRNFRSAMLGVVAQGFHRAGQFTLAEQFAHQAADAAVADDKLHSFGLRFRQLIGALAEAGASDALDRVLALRVAEDRSKEYKYAITLALITMTLAEAGDEARARRYSERALAADMPENSRAAVVQLVLQAMSAYAGDQDVDQITRLPEQLTQSDERALALTYSGRALARLGNASLARRQLELGLDAYGTSPHDAYLSEALVAAAQAYAELGDDARLRDMLDRAQLLSKIESRLDTMADIALLLAERGQAAAARDAVETIFASAGKGKPRPMIDQAMDLIDVGRLEAATRVARDEEDMIRQGASTSWIGLARVWTRLGDNRRARELLQQAKTFIDESPETDAQKARFEYNIARAFHELGDDAEALSNLERAAKKCLLKDDSYEKVELLTSLTRLAMETGDTVVATEIMRDTDARVAHFYPYLRRQRVSALCGMARVWSDAGNRERALRLLGSARSYAEASDKYDKGESLICVLRASRELGRTEEPMQLANITAEFLSTLERPDPRLMSGLAVEMVNLGQCRRALLLLEEAVACLRAKRRKSTYDLLSYAGIVSGFRKLNRIDQSISLMAEAFRLAAELGKDDVIRIMEAMSADIAAYDNGESLERIYLALGEVESWCGEVGPGYGHGLE